MRIAMVASECEPFAKTGGLADVVDALSRALGEAGHEVDVYLPLYRGVTPPVPTEGIELRVDFAAGGRVVVGLLTGPARGYRIRLVDHPASFDRPDYYVADGTDYPDNGFRFTLLGRTALEAMRVEGRPADILHGHDWQAAPALLAVRRRFGRDASLGRIAAVMTCHNLAYHGWVPRSEVTRQLDLPADVGAPDGVDLLREGIRTAEIVNTVSPTFARESLAPEFGAGLDDVLRSLGDRYIGILNGIDSDLWNPATDTEIAAPYSSNDLTGKADCRTGLCAELGLDPDGPVLALVGRLDPQKGFDLLTAAAPELIARGARLCVLGTGDHRLLGSLLRLAGEERGRLAIVDAFDRGLARRIYAGADCFLMPSRFEPCGQGQMIAMRYGTIPIVRRTGGLADTIFDADEQPDTGNGFSFGPAEPRALADACARAMTAYSDATRWRRIQQRAMAADHSWARPAGEYMAAYERALAIARQ